MSTSDDLLRSLVKLEPAPTVELLERGGTPLAGRALAIAPSAVVVELDDEVEPPDGPVLVRISGGEGTLEVTARPAAGHDGSGLLLSLTDLDAEQEAAVERFITRNRKADHLRICRDDDVQTLGAVTGFDAYRLPHEPLPELALDEVDLSVEILGKRLAAPILISCMTGGSELAKVVNRRLAAAAERHGLALGLGSQRALLVDPGLLDTYAVRDLAPTTLLFGNLGAVQLNYGVDRAGCDRLVELVEADALYLHLNPLQEALQPEGDTDFRGLKTKVAALAEAVDYPVLLKEVGNGISPGLAAWTATTSLAGVDVAGAGGTSWARVEGYRAERPGAQRTAELFGGWGWPTAEAVVHCRAALPDRLVVASGGIRHGLDAARAIALGADLAGLARPFLKAAMAGEAALEALIGELLAALRVACFCAGAGSIAQLRTTEITRRGTGG